MEEVDAFPHVGDAHKHILDNMLLLIELLYLLALCQFQQRHFRWHEPTKEVSEDHIVSKGNNVLNLPENGPVGRKDDSVLMTLNIDDSLLLTGI